MSLRFVLCHANGDAQLLTSDDVAYAGVAKLPGGLVALSLTLRPGVDDATPAGHAFTLRTDAQTALSMLGDYLGSVPVEAPPRRRPGAAQASGRGDVLPLFAPPVVEPVEAVEAVEAVEPVEAPPVVEPVEAPPVVEPVEPPPVVEPVEAPPVVEPVEPRAGFIPPRPMDTSKAHPGSAHSGGYHPSEREPKPRERGGMEIETTPLSPAELAALPRPLLRQHAAADLLNLGEDHGLSTRQLGARWGWSNSTVSVFLRRAVVKAASPSEGESPANRQRIASESPAYRQQNGHINRLRGTISPAYRQRSASVSPANRQQAPLSELLLELDTLATRPAPHGLVARYMRRCAEEGVYDGGAAALAKRWGWDVHELIRLRTSIHRSTGKKLAQKLGA